MEYCKFVLSLAPESDPFGALLVIDYYALRAREYEYLLEFVGGRFSEEFYPSKGKASPTLLLVPNLLYSAALAKKMRNLDSPTKEPHLSEDFEKLRSIKNFNDVMKLSENSILMLAIVMYPTLIRRIINKIKGPTSAAWDPVLKGLKAAFKVPGKYYDGYSWICKDRDLSCRKATLSKLYTIYEEKAANCFGSELVHAWVRAVCNFMCEGAGRVGQSYESLRDSLSSSGTCPFYLDRYAQLNVVAFREDVTTIPPEELNPLIENALFAPQAQGEAAVPQQPAGPPPNPLALFFRTLFIH